MTLTVQERGKDALLRFRMDFLMLLPNGVSVVLEVDGKQHYAGADSKADSDKYAAMAAADRDLRLSGYDVYRFGAKELMATSAPDMVGEFFECLFRAHRLSLRTERAFGPPSASGVGRQLIVVARGFVDGVDCLRKIFHARQKLI